MLLSGLESYDYGVAGEVKVSSLEALWPDGEEAIVRIGSETEVLSGF